MISYNSDLGRVKIKIKKSVHQIAAVLLGNPPADYVELVGTLSGGACFTADHSACWNNPPRLLSWEGVPKLCTMCRLDFNRICCSDLTKA